jgi:hypothetical protein
MWKVIAPASFVSNRRSTGKTCAAIRTIFLLCLAETRFLYHGSLFSAALRKPEHLMCGSEQRWKARFFGMLMVTLPTQID